MKVLMPRRFIDRNVGGNTTYAHNLAAQLRRRGVEVGKFGSASNPVTALISENIAASQRRESGSVIHYVADTGPLLPVRGPSVLTVHGVASRWISTARSPQQEALWRFRVAHAIKHTRELVTVSESSADDIAEIFGVDRPGITVIHHGIDHAMFATPVELSPELRTKIPDEFVLYVGNLEPRKNLEALAQAFSHPALRSLGLPLVVAGKPAWNYGAIMATLEKSPDVMYVGFVSDKDRAALMQNCALFVFPSLYEGFGFPVLEAMTAGSPVLTSDRGSLREVAGPARIANDLGASGLVLDIAAALDDREWQRSSRVLGRDWVKKFSWERSGEEHIRIYERSQL